MTLSAGNSLILASNIGNMSTQSFELLSSEISWIHPSIFYTCSTLFRNSGELEPIPAFVGREYTLNNIISHTLFMI